MKRPPDIAEYLKDHPLISLIEDKFYNRYSIPVKYYYNNTIKKIYMKSIVDLRLFILFYESKDINMYNEFYKSTVIVPGVGDYIKAVTAHYTFKIEYKSKVFYVCTSQNKEDTEFINLSNYYRSINSQPLVLLVDSLDDFIMQFRSLDSLSKNKKL